MLSSMLKNACSFLSLNGCLENDIFVIARSWGIEILIPWMFLRRMGPVMYLFDYERGKWWKCVGNVRKGGGKGVWKVVENVSFFFFWDGRSGMV